jgi:hypothetical protein
MGCIGGVLGVLPCPARLMNGSADPVGSIQYQGLTLVHFSAQC